MPWCVSCDRFFSPPTVRPDGTCPTCGRAVEVAAARVKSEKELPPIPWHLKLLAGSFVVYLGFRAFQGVEWLTHRLGH